MKKERRLFARMYLGVEAFYKEKGSQKAQSTIFIQDISLIGIRFIANHMIKEGSILEFILNIPNIPTPISATGRVVWQKKFSESYYDTGINFMEIEPDHKDNLREYLKNHLGRVEEKRNFMRINFSSMVSYRLNKEDMESVDCLSVDISEVGLRVYLKKHIDAGTNLRIAFNLPDDTHQIKVDGEIVWISKIEENVYDAGIKFLNLSDEDSKRIADFVKKITGSQW